MTTLQLKLVLAIKEYGSISNAAKELDISQPNASNYVKVLEQELGFEIFRRLSTGMTVTPKGEQFLIYARQITDMNDKAMNLRNAEDVYRLRLGTVNYYSVAEPFFQICAEHRDDAKNDLCLYNVSIFDGIQRLLRQNLDIVAVPVMKHQLVGLKRECQSAGVEIRSICEIPSVIMLRNGHPAIKDGRCMNITQGSDAMKDFPYIGMRNLSETSASTDYSDTDFVQCSYKILVDDTNMRLRMIEATNGFGFGIQSSYRLFSQFDITYFPVPGVTLELLCLTLPEAEKQPAVKDYLMLLKKEMSRISL